jgi:hypothetical protein
MRSYTLHVTLLADDDEHAVKRGGEMVAWLTAGSFAPGADDWDVSDTVDWSEIVDRPVSS